VLTVVLGAGLAVWLLLAYGREDPLGAIRTAGTVVIGSGGGAALLLAARRQRTAEIALVQKDRDQDLQERVAKETQSDAKERRITDLYTKAVEQLGSEKAPVRLGGLYALERLAQDNEHQRQTIANVLCAYLRMPYESDEREEREVRLTAQRLLTTHVRSDSSSLWRGMRLDLTGAQLIDFVMIEGDVSWVSFAGATFVGDTMFLDTTFPNYANFREATFLGVTHFQGSKFTGPARFENVRFAEHVSFTGLKKDTSADFAQTAIFEGATFDGSANFAGVTFHSWARFGQPRGGPPVNFAKEAWFGSARFKSYALFKGATFAAKADFKKVTFDAPPPPRFPKMPKVEASTDFQGATFADGVPPEVEPYR
jgi:uncharacterized protein YjbI with pentapeptide repeats